MASSASSTTASLSPPTERTPLVASQVAVPKQDETPSWGEVLRFCMRYLIPSGFKFKVYTVVYVLLTIVFEALQLAPAIFTKFIIEKIVEGSGKAPTWQVVPWKLIVLSFLVGEASDLVSVFRNNLQTSIFAQLHTQVSVELFEHIHNLSLSFHLEKKTGEILKIFGRTSGSVCTIFTFFAFGLIPLVVQTVLVSGIFFQFGLPILSIICFVGVAMSLTFTFYITGIRAELNRKERDTDNAVGDCQVETLSAFEVVMSFGRNQAEVERYEHLSSAAQTATWRRNIIFTWLGLVNRCIQKSGRYLVTWIACGMTFVEGAGRFSAGDFTLIPSLYSRLFSPFRAISSHYNAVTSALTRLEQTVAVWKTVPEFFDADDAVDLKKVDRYVDGLSSIEFENVSFRYKSDDVGTPTGAGISGLSFKVAPGRTIALVGETGSGKTTASMYSDGVSEVSREGRVLVAGQDIKGLTQKSLRESIGIVSQQTVLFNDTLLYNIRYSRPDATIEEVMHVSKLAALDDFIMDQKKGLMTVVGERGVKLSGGQLQRVGIARALLKNAPILLLDEATAALDSDTEIKVQSGLDSLSAGRTTITIAHRLATISKADEIIVLEKGRVKERGTHTRLIEMGGTYAELWAIQTGKQLKKSKSADRTIAELEHLSDS